jgi:hypothetical protein
LSQPFAVVRKYYKENYGTLTKKTLMKNKKFSKYGFAFGR